jgi:predicted glycosyltransferase
MRVWVDLTNSPHVLVLAPVIRRLEAAGHQVDVTARDFAQTLGLCERLGIAHTAIGTHRGGSLGAKAVGLLDRSAALTRYARGKRFDLAIGHGSNDISVAARLLGIPCSTTFDYEWATVQHNVNCRLAQAVVVPAVIPPERLYRYGARHKIHQYVGLKEEYYLADFEPDPAVLSELGLDRSAPIAVVRTPPAVSLYHRFENDTFGEVLAKLQGAQTVVLPRTPEQRAELTRAGGYLIPERAIDAQSLIAYADLVISAGGTMNREAVALGTPVYTVFEGRLGAVDAELIASGRLAQLTAAADVELVKRPAGDAPQGSRIRRDPALLVDLLAAPALSPWRG